MTRQRTSAEIEAGAKALWEAEFNSAPWPVVDARVQSKYRTLAESVTAAADAAAAPAVGVTVEWLDARIAESEPELEQQSLTIQARNQARAEAFREVRALLTAQPEPGTGKEQG